MRGTTLSVLVWWAVLTCQIGAADWPFAHVRSDEPSFRAIVTEGYQRSATFKALIDELDSQPGIVYIASIAKLSQGMEGALLHAVAGSPSLPVLRVLLKGHPAGDHAIALVAHELRHVVEVLRAGATSSPTAMTRFFASLDAAHSAGMSKLETEAAQEIAARVRRELQQSARINARP